jgi:hypothetical protein
MDDPAVSTPVLVIAMAARNFFQIFVLGQNATCENERACLGQ